MMREEGGNRRLQYTDGASDRFSVSVAMVVGLQHSDQTRGSWVDMYPLERICPRKSVPNKYKSLIECVLRGTVRIFHWFHGNPTPYCGYSM